MIGPIRRDSLYMQVFKQILNAIQNGRWKPKERLPSEKELADIFEVGRNSVRSALKSLEVMGIVNSYAGRGTFVSTDALAYIKQQEMKKIIDEYSANDLMEARLVVEVQLAYMAAKRADDGDIERLRVQQECLREAIDKGSPDWLKYGLGFHMMIAKAANNAILVHFLESIHAGLKRQREQLAVLKAEDNPEMIEDHETLLKLIETGDALGARLAMEKHLLRAVELLENQGHKLQSNE